MVATQLQLVQKKIKYRTTNLDHTPKGGKSRGAAQKLFGCVIRTPREENLEPQNIFQIIKAQKKEDIKLKKG